ncbi:hypothetical protein [Vibrio crassostreae]|uniref:hypothetical protein n=1 Tax=Vibrio crassostreae TaxID=246167 RepID=UPI001B3072BA|nr:hypothetical protein [Vibrio crassostreae]
MKYLITIALTLILSGCGSEDKPAYHCSDNNKVYLGGAGEQFTQNDCNDIEKYSYRNGYLYSVNIPNVTMQWRVSPDEGHEDFPIQVVLPTKMYRHSQNSLCYQVTQRDTSDLICPDTEEYERIVTEYSRAKWLEQVQIATKNASYFG